MTKGLPLKQEAPHFSAGRFTEAMEKLNQEGFELLDIDNRHNDFFSSLTAMMVNKEGGGKSGFIKFRKTESAISRAIH